MNMPPPRNNAFDSDEPTRNLFVAGLCPWVNDKAIREVFEPYGAILSAKVMLDIHSGHSRGFGFVLFEALDCSVKAKEELDGTVKNSSRLHIRYSPHSGDNLLLQVPNLYVRNIPSYVSESHLRDLFGSKGDLKLMTIRPDTTPKDKGGHAGTQMPDRKSVVVYLEYDTHQTAQKVVDEFHGANLFPGEPVPVLAKMAEPPHLRNFRRQKFRAEHTVQARAQHSATHKSGGGGSQAGSASATGSDGNAHYSVRGGTGGGGGRQGGDRQNRGGQGGGPPPPPHFHQHQQYGNGGGGGHGGPPSYGNPADNNQQQYNQQPMYPQQHQPYYPQQQHFYPQQYQHGNYNGSSDYNQQQQQYYGGGQQQQAYQQYNGGNNQQQQWSPVMYATTPIQQPTAASNNQQPYFIQHPYQSGGGPPPQQVLVTRSPNHHAVGDQQGGSGSSNTASPVEQAQTGGLITTNGIAAPFSTPHPPHPAGMMYQLSPHHQGNQGTAATLTPGGSLFVLQPSSAGSGAQQLTPMIQASNGTFIAAGGSGGTLPHGVPAPIPGSEVNAPVFLIPAARPQSVALLPLIEQSPKPSTADGRSAPVSGTDQVTPTSVAEQY